MKKTIYEQLTSAECLHCGAAKKPLRDSHRVTMHHGDKAFKGVILESDIGARFGGNFGGRVLEVDVGKLVYANTCHRILELESDSQFKARTKKT